MFADTGAIFATSQEEQAIRDAVHDIVDSFGPDYYQRQVDDGANCGELWNALGTKGYLGVHLPEKYGGGGLGLRELAIVVQETALGGCPLQAMLFSAGVTGTILNRTPVTSRAPVAAGRGHRRNTFVARDYRARCRLECPWAKPRVDTIISLGGDPADDASRAFRAAEALDRKSVV